MPKKDRNPWMYVRRNNIRERHNEAIHGPIPDPVTLGFLREWAIFNDNTWRGNHEVPVLYRDGLTSCKSRERQAFIETCRVEGKIVEFIPYSQYFDRVHASPVEVIPGSATRWSEKPSSDDSREPEIISKVTFERRIKKLTRIMGRELKKGKRWAPELEFLCSRGIADALEAERNGENVLLEPISYEAWAQKEAAQKDKKIPAIIPVINENNRRLQEAASREAQALVEEREAASGLLLLANSAGGILNPDSTSSSSSTSSLSGNKRGPSDIAVQEDAEPARRRPFDGGESSEKYSESSSSFFRPVGSMQYSSGTGYYGFLPPPPPRLYETMPSQQYPAAVQEQPVVPMRYSSGMGYYGFLPPPSSYVYANEEERPRRPIKNMSGFLSAKFP